MWWVESERIPDDRVESSSRYIPRAGIAHRAFGAQEASAAYTEA
jgi:hypothetical protein